MPPTAKHEFINNIDVINIANVVDPAIHNKINKLKRKTA